VESLRARQVCFAYSECEKQLPSAVVNDAAPLTTLADWIAEARAAGLPEHDAATLATADDTGRPTARIVSARRVEPSAVIFTTALWTRKARDLRANPHAALLFHWPVLGRQVHVGGNVEPAERALAEEIFGQRDRPHQLQSAVSRQGDPIEDLTALRARLALVRREVGAGPVPCPDDWGAMRLRAEFVEYWSASPDALHDRRVFARVSGGGWRMTRLAP
jgi:pyridoxamine 5'-phosphate oxidase